jgi:hypothetical protein
MSTNPPVSFRVAFESQIAKLPPEHQEVIRTQWNAITDLYGAIPSLKKQITSLQKPASATTTATGNITENITTISNTILGFSVSNQTGATAYTVQQSDNGAILILNDASPIAVTLDTTLAVPYGVIPVNQGAGLVTLTPSTGTINGAANLTVPEGYFAIAGSDGTNWFAAVLPIVPLTLAPVDHEFLTGYDDTTGDFSAAQPAIADVSGLSAALALLAPIASPTFTGTVMQPTPSVLTAAATDTSATAGAASALPATPALYLEVSINGTVYKIPAYSI